MENIHLNSFGPEEDRIPKRILPCLNQSSLNRRAGYLCGVVTQLPCEYLCRQGFLARFPTLTRFCLIYVVVQVENYTIFSEQLFKVDLVETLCNSFLFNSVVS